MTTTAKRQAPLKIDPATDELITQAAHFLGMTKKDFVTEAVKAYLEQRREQVRQGMIESMRVLDGSLTTSVAALTGLSPERIDQLGGTGDWEA
jgi:Arc/MetJ family transcription regulator